MARHEGSSRAVSMSTVAVAMALLLLLGFEHGDAATTFVVGDSNGWNLGMEGWPNGKVFRAGDILSEFSTLVLIVKNDALILC